MRMWHVVIVHYNTSKLTSELVRSLPKRTISGASVLIHLLDNASDDRAFELLRAAVADMPHVTLRRNATNIGFGAGVNETVGLINADADDLLWILNPDTVLQADCLTNLERTIDTGQFDILSPVIVRQSGSIWYAGGTIDLTRVKVRHLHDGHQTKDLPTVAFTTQFVTGAAPLMTIATWRSLGGYPKGYFLYWEDVVMSVTATSNDLRLGVEPAARLVHLAGSSSAGRGLSAVFYYWSTRNRLRFARGRGISRPQLLLGRAGIETLRFIVRAGMEPEGRRTRVSAAIRGTMSGLRNERIKDVRIFPQIRSIHLEQASADPAHTLYFYNHFDFDQGIVRAHQLVEKSSPTKALAFLLRTRLDTLELPEPLWLRWLPFTVSAAFLVRCRSRILGYHTQIVTYALQRSPLSQLVSFAPRWLRPAVRLILRLVLKLCAICFDKVAFGTSDSAHTYDSAAGGSWQVRSQIVVPPYLAPCQCVVQARASRTVLFATGLEARKGLDVLLAAWPLVTQQVPSARLRVAGSGPLEAQVREMAARDASVTFLGALNRAQIHLEFRRASVVVLLSRAVGAWSEQIGLPILEGIAHGCFIVTTEDTGLSRELAGFGYDVVPASPSLDVVTSALVHSLSTCASDKTATLSTVVEDGRTTADKWLRQSPA